MSISLLILHATLWDGTGAPEYQADILVQDGLIAAIGQNLVAPEGARVLDASGATVIPGLVDAHVHLPLDPGARFRQTTPEEHAALLDAHLRAYLACGVTSILDPAIVPEELALVRSHLAAGVPGPRFLTLGTPISPKGGYVAVVIPAFPSVSTPAELDAALDLVASQDTVGVKTTLEPGFGRPIWPVYSPELREQIRTGAAARGLTIYTHAMSAETQRMAIDELGARVLVHPLSHPDAEFAQYAAEREVTEISTLAVVDSFRTGWSPERLDDPLVRLVVPPVELATARDPKVVRAFEREFVHTALPRLPQWGALIRLGLRASVGPTLRKQMAALRQLADAGVPIVMGSDSGNWPVIPYEFHGPTSLREMELLGEAGFSPAEVLTAATLAPARMMGIEAEQGTLEVGKVADLLIVDGDPLTDLGALRHLRYTVRAGEAKTPQEWAAAP